MGGSLKAAEGQKSASTASRASSRTLEGPGLPGGDRFQSQDSHGINSLGLMSSGLRSAGYDALLNDMRPRRQPEGLQVSWVLTWTVMC